MLCPNSSRGQLSTYYSLRSKLRVRSNTLQLGEYLGEEAGLRIDPQHCSTEIAILYFYYYFLNYTAGKLLYFLHYPHSIVCVPELVDDGDAAVPKLFLVSLHKERFQGVAEMR